MKTFRTMLKTELKLSLRGMDMFIFAICVPVVVLVILGISTGKLAIWGQTIPFWKQSFGAIATISNRACGVMGLPLVVSDYRSKKILKRYQVTPGQSGPSILFVQVVIYTLYAVVSFLLLYLTGALFFGYRFNGSVLHFLGGYLLVLVSMFSIGMTAGGIAPDENSGVNRQYSLLPHADIFRGNTSL